MTTIYSNNNNGKNTALIKFQLAKSMELDIPSTIVDGTIQTLHNTKTQITVRRRTNEQITYVLT